MAALIGLLTAADNDHLVSKENLEPPTNITREVRQEGNVPRDTDRQESSQDMR